MARPRIFISSTFYDLRYARVSLEAFVKEMGYESVLNERGNIPYGTEEALQNYCYSEISKVSMLVSIIGGRFGSKSAEDRERSISNMELKTAIQLGKQVYIFVEAGVLSEYQTYLKNKDNTSVKYSHVDDRRIHDFIDEIYALSRNNQIASFSEVPHIVSYLKEQWAGLLESYLEKRYQEKIGEALARIESTTETLNSLVDILRNENIKTSGEYTDRQLALDEIVLQNHPFFTALKRVLKPGYRVFFTSKTEMDQWLKARSCLFDDNAFQMDEKYYEYNWSNSKKQYFVQVHKELFDEEERLIPMSHSNWSESFLLVTDITQIQKVDDDIPF